MADEHQQQIIDTLARNIQQVQHQFKHTHIQLGVLMMAKRLGPPNHIQERPLPVSLVAPETDDVGEVNDTITEERRNNIGRRKSFAVEQLLGLEFHYSQSRYLKGKRLSVVADQLKLTKNQVKIWFQNRRAKENRYRRMMTKEVGKRLDEYSLHRLQTTTTTPPPKLSPNMVLPPPQQQSSASHSLSSCHLNMPITSSLLLRDTCHFTKKPHKNIDLAERALSSSRSFSPKTDAQLE